MANIHDISRNAFMLRGPLAKKGYDWWWHSLTAENAETGEKKPFYIEFFAGNPARAADEPVIVWNDPGKQAKGILPSYVMVNVGFWGADHGQLHNFYAWKDVSLHPDAPYAISCGGCTCSETHTEGTVAVTAEQRDAHPEWMCDAGPMSWKLDIDKQIAFHVGYGAGKFFRDINAFEMFWHAEGMKSRYSGEIILNGVKYLVKPETCNGYADKNWGGDFTCPWVWRSSNDLRSKITGKKLENSVFNIGGGRPKVGPVALDRKLLGEFYYEGKDYELNFSKFWTLSGTKFDCEETADRIHWHVVQTTATARLDTEIWCNKSDMLNINYEAPTGLKRHNRLWNGGNGWGVLKLYKRGPGGKEILIDEVEATGIGCEFGEYDK